MYYFDELDMIENLPNIEDVDMLDFKDDVLSLKMKDGSNFKLIEIVESLTQQEFKSIFNYLGRRMVLEKVNNLK